MLVPLRNVSGFNMYVCMCVHVHARVFNVHNFLVVFDDLRVRVCACVCFISLMHVSLVQ